MTTAPTPVSRDYLLRQGTAVLLEVTVEASGGGNHRSRSSTTPRRRCTCSPPPRTVVLDVAFSLLWCSSFSVICTSAVARGVCRTLTAVCIRQQSGHACRISCIFGCMLRSCRSVRLCCYHGRPGRSECTSV